MSLHDGQRVGCTPVTWTGFVACWLLAIGCSSSESANTGGAGGNSGGSRAGGSTTASQSCPADSLVPENVGLVTGMVSDGTTVYFTTIPDSSSAGGLDESVTLQSVPVTGGTPTVLATGDTGLSMSTFLLDGETLQFFLDGRVRTLPKTGGQMTQIYDPEVALPLAFRWATDATSIYVGDIYADAGRWGVYQIPKTGGAATRLYLEEEILQTEVVGVDETNVYVSELPPLVPVGDGGIGQELLVSLPKAGGSKMVLAAFERGSGIYGQPMLTADHVVYTVVQGSLETTVYAVKKTGGQPMVLAQAGNPALAVAADGFVYYQKWTYPEKVPVSGGAATEIHGHSLSGSVLALATDATYLYLAEALPGCIFKVPR